MSLRVRAGRGKQATQSMLQLKLIRMLLVSMLIAPEMKSIVWMDVCTFACSS